MDVDDREPIIEWELLQDQQAEDARFTLAVRVRNPHIDLVFGNLVVELSVKRKSERAEDEEIVLISPKSRLAFGDLHFAQSWETREVTLQGAGSNRERLLVYVIATWTVWTVGFSSEKRTMTTDFTALASTQPDPGTITDYET